MERKIIHILGASGAGTTTLGRAIGNGFGYTHLDSDNYYWLPTDPPFTESREKEERIRLLREDIEKNEKCVLSGSLCGWGDCVIPCFICIIRIVTPREIRIKRLKEREYARFGPRILQGGDMYEAHMKFLDWAASYDTGDETMRSKKRHDLWLNAIDCPQYVVDGTASVEQNLLFLKNKLF